MAVPAHKTEYFIIENSNLQKKANTPPYFLGVRHKPEIWLFSQTYLMSVLLPARIQAVMYLLYTARQVQTMLLLPQIPYLDLLQDQIVTNYYCKHSIRVLTVLSYFLFQHGKLFCVKKFG